jgi:stress response protein YsnF
MKQTVFGIFDKQSDAQNAVKRLVDDGFSHGLIDVHSTRSDAATGTADNTANRNNDSNDGIGGFFSNLFGSDNDEASTYSDVARRGTVVTVHATSEDEAERAARVLDKFGAIDANERAMKYRQEGRTGADHRETTGNDKSIPVIEEQMEVGKREVETGGVSIRSRIIERPVEEHLRLREEHVSINRNPVDRPATEADFRNFKEGEAEMTEHSEVPVVNKESRVVEEVNLKKETRERDQTIKDRVRETDVDVKKTQKDKDVSRRDR